MRLDIENDSGRFPPVTPEKATSKRVSTHSLQSYLHHTHVTSSIHPHSRTLFRSSPSPRRAISPPPDMASEAIAFTLTVVTAVVVLRSVKEERVSVATALSFRALDSTGVFKLSK